MPYCRTAFDFALPKSRRESATLTTWFVEMSEARLYGFNEWTRRKAISVKSLLGASVSLGAVQAQRRDSRYL